MKNHRAITERIVKEVFRMGTTRYTKMKKEEMYKENGGRSVYAFTDDDVDMLRAFVESIPTEPGYPCNHRRQKQ
jgi:hypothetical protein